MHACAPLQLIYDLLIMVCYLAPLLGALVLALQVLAGTLLSDSQIAFSAAADIPTSKGFETFIKHCAHVGILHVSSTKPPSLSSIHSVRRSASNQATSAASQRLFPHYAVPDVWHLCLRRGSRAQVANHAYPGAGRVWKEGIRPCWTTTRWRR